MGRSWIPRFRAGEGELALQHMLIDQVRPARIGGSRPGLVERAAAGVFRSEMGPVVTIGCQDADEELAILAQVV